MNFQLYNDKVWTFPLQCKNAAGVVQPFPAGSPSAVSSNPASLNALVGLGAKLVLTPLVQSSPNITVTVTNLGMSPTTFLVDIVADPNLLTLAVDSAAADVTSAPQNVPTAPGP